MSGGPFRDTLTPLLEDAQDQLTRLRKRRAALETRYLLARARLEETTRPRPARLVLRPREADAGPAPDAWRTAFVVGAIAALVFFWR